MDLFNMASENTAKKGGEIEIPPPEILTLQSDGINIVAALFTSPNAEDPELAKEIAPVILVQAKAERST